jgi:hypothetical protein
MTANRWWVRYGARWLARFKTTEGQLRSFSLAVTAFSTFSLMLQNAGYGQYVPHVGALAVIAWATYTFYYSEGGVHNQTQRDMVDLSTNFAGPTMRIDDEIIGCGVFAAVHGRPPDEEEREVISDAVDSPWKEYRDGIEVPE